MSDTTQPTRPSTSLELIGELCDLGIQVSETVPEAGGALFDDLRLLYPVGKGGMGVVLRGRDDALDIDVAVKVITAHYAFNKEFISRLISEARAIARLDHPNIVRVLRVGEFLKQHFLVMEFINGQDVHQMIKRTGPVAAFHAAQIAAAAASALVYAHRKGVIHRDIKPHNILVSHDREKIKLVDFGIARDFTQDLRATQESLAMGTPIYMAPEQLHGGEADEFSDIYSLGITLYNMLAGDVEEELQSRVFDPEGRGQRALSVEATQTPKDASFFNDLIESMCEPQPKDRPLLIDVLGSLEEYLQRAQEQLNEGKTRATSAPRSRRSTKVSTRGNLREPLSTFIGRQDELARLATVFGVNDEHVDPNDQDFTVEKARLVTLHGSGGTGKTRLAQRFAALYRDNFAGGVWFTDLSTCRKVEDICHAVGGAFRFEIKSAEDPVSITANALAGQAENAGGPLLLILDNFEQCLDFASTTVGEWLNASREILILVTSRILLNLEGEYEFPLGAMGLPPKDAELPFADESTKTLARQYENFDAVRLFISRARSSAPDTTIDREQYATVVEICRRLDGNPLALELAASRIKVLPPGKLLERLDNRFELLRSDRRNAGKRQSTLRSTIDWSWDLLEKWERSALTQLSTFSAGFTLEAAEAIISLGEFEEAPPVLDVVQSLRDKSLIYRRDPEASHLDLRFGLYESIREYADERKAEQLDDDELAALHMRFGAFFVAYMRRLDKEAFGPDAPHVLDRLELEVQNLLNAQDILLAMNAPYLAAQAICSTSFVMHVRGPHSKRVRRLVESLHAINPKETDIGKIEVPSGRDLRQAFAPLPEWADQDIDALEVLAQTIEVLNNLTTAYQDDGDTLAAERSAERAVNLARGLLSCLEDPDHESLWRESSKLLSKALDGLSAVEERRANYPRALTLLGEAEEIERELEDENGLANILSNRGNIYIRSGDADEALDCYRTAEGICRRTGNMIGLTINVSNRGWVALNLRLYDDALHCCNEAERLSRELRFNNGLGWNIGCIGSVHKAKGELEEALLCFEEAEAIYRDMGNLVSVATNVGLRGSVYLEMGRYNDALVCFAEAEGITRKAGDQDNLSHWVGSRAQALAKLGHATAALKAYAEAEARSEAVNAKGRLALFIAGRAAVYLKLERPEEAVLLLDEAKSMLVEVGASETAQYLETLSHLAQAHYALREEDAEAPAPDPDATRVLRKSKNTCHILAAEEVLVEGLTLASQLEAEKHPSSSGTYTALARLKNLAQVMKEPRNSPRP